LNRICIVGASGYVGSHLAAGLRRQGISVQALSSRDGTGIDPSTGLLPIDLRLDEGTEAVVYAAQSPHYRQVPEMAWHLQAISCVSAMQAAAAARRAGARRFIYLSTGNVYSPSFDPLSEDAPTSGAQWYPLSKLQGEQSLALLRPAIDVTIVRVFAIYGPHQPDKLVPRLAASVDQRRPVMLAYRETGVPDRGLRMNPCYIDDAVAVLTQLALEGGPPVLNLGGPEVVGVKDIAECWGRLRGVEPIFQSDRSARSFDLIGDTRLLHSYSDHRFLSMDEGLARIAAATPVETPGA
jgi:nucleoside-diphosphate-sugar epimerase